MADYRIEGSDTILVPAEQEVRLKAALAQQGYPKSGFAYSMYLDHVGSLTTEGEQGSWSSMSLRIALRRWFVALTGFRRPSWISRRGRTTHSFWTAKTSMMPAPPFCDHAGRSRAHSKAGAGHPQFCQPLRSGTGN